MKMLSGRGLVLSCLVPAVMLGCGLRNPIPAGQVIPDTEILSCGDALVGVAKPSGALASMTLTVSDVTTLSGGLSWQASCPKQDTTLSTEFVLNRVVIYRDDAGFPGAKLGETTVEVRGKVSCDERWTTSIGGITQSEDLGPQQLFSLRDLCVEYQAGPTGSPLFVHVEMTGSATTCSAVTSELLFRTKNDVSCNL